MYRILIISGIAIIFLIVLGVGKIYYDNKLSPNAAMFSAIDKNNLIDLKKSISRGASPNATDQILTTPLSIACANNNYSIAEYLLNKGASPNVADGDGYTPLMYACVKGGSKVRQVAVEK
jgi:ankyrin repeat protein